MSLGHTPVNQKVYHHILNMVLTQQLVPGSRLDEQALAKQLGVSRTPLREAIGRLSEKGLVEYRPYQGNFVRVFSSDEIRGIYEVRRSLEELAIRSGIARMTPDCLEEIRAILDRLTHSMDTGDIEGVSRADSEFHARIAASSGNQTLIAMLNDLDHQIQVIRSIANQNPEVVRQTALQRPQILAALESRDADEAARLLGEHIAFVAESMLSENPSSPGHEASDLISVR